MTTWLHLGRWLLIRSGLALALAVVPALVFAADGGSDKSPGKAGSSAGAVDLFDGIAQGELSVKFIPKNSTEARVLIENKTDKPLSVKMPEAFAGVPVLAQPAPGNVTGTQSMGTGMGMGMQGGGGMFNVPAEKVVQVRVPTVCLEHGKGEPRAAIPCEIRPLESVTSNPEVRENLQLLGTKKLNQRVAQAAVWHFTNNMSWESWP